MSPIYHDDRVIWDRFWMQRNGSTVCAKNAQSLMMVIELFYFSAGGHIKTIFLKKTLDKSIKIEGFALKMMTFFREAFQVNRKSYPERVRSALFHAIKKTAANLDACVKVPGKDFSRKRKLPLQTMLLMLIGMGGGSLSKEL